MATSASNQEHVYTLSDEGPMEAFGCAFRTINRTPELENEVEERAAPAPLMQGLLRQLSSFSLDGIDVSKESDLDIPSGFDFEAFVNTPEQAAQGMLEQATPQVPSAPPWKLHRVRQMSNLLTCRRTYLPSFKVPTTELSFRPHMAQHSSWRIK